MHTALSVLVQLAAAAPRLQRRFGDAMELFETSDVATCIVFSGGHDVSYCKFSDALPVYCSFDDYHIDSDCGQTRRLVDKYSPANTSP